MLVRIIKILIVSSLVMILVIGNFAQVSADSYVSLSYNDYLKNHSVAEHPESTVMVTAANLDAQDSKNTELLKNYAGCATAVKTNSDGIISYKYQVAQAGLYNIAVRYIAFKGKDIPIERKILINGQVPFSDFNDMVFDLIWQDGKITTDKNGNEYIPEQIEKFQFREVTLHSDEQTNDSYQVYLNAGVNTITFTSYKESMAIDYIKFYQQPQAESYNDYLNAHEKVAKNNDVQQITVQAEDEYEKSDISLYPLNDRTSPLTTSSSMTKVILNTIGGQNWSNIKQSITWQVNVKTDGLYKLNIRFKQDYNEGISTFRRLYIDGSLPFREVSQIEFKYSQGWQVMSVGDASPYLFYLTKGTHEVSLECVYGKTAAVYDQVKTAITSLNDLYRKIIMITSLTPDPNRDYNLEQAIPELSETLKNNENALENAKNQLYKLTGIKGQDYSLIETLEMQIKAFRDKTYTIPSRLSSFSLNISDLSTWIMNGYSQPLLLDYLQFAPEQQPLPRADVNFSQKILYDIKSLFLSFFNNYDMLANSDSTGTHKSITLWLGSGHDQANAIKSLIDNNFTKKYGVSVKIRLVDINALMPAVASGSGPDVAIAQDRTMPLNYGFRGAVYNLAKFSDCNQVLKQFPAAAVTPFKYNKLVYGLPDTFVFPMMFYRKDILQDLNMSVPQTWDDVYSMLPKLSNKYLNFGVPNVATSADIFYTLLFQSGGGLYDSKLDSAVLDSELSIHAFSEWSDLYTKYSMPQSIDSFTRFRTGQAPIVIAPYNFYNQLIAAAPEINGLWDMTLVPGTKTADGKINRQVDATSTASVIFQNSKDKDSSWTFLKWWVSSDAQVKYDQQLEILLGPSGRVPVACIDALDELPWSTDDVNKIETEMQNAVGVPEVPGGYMTQRYVNTAILLTINDGTSPREAITSYNKLVNDEIKAKRQEFGLQ